jgi:hypothetical protein
LFRAPPPARSSPSFRAPTPEQSFRFVPVTIRPVLPLSSTSPSAFIEQSFRFHRAILPLRSRHHPPNGPSAWLVNRLVLQVPDGVSYPFPGEALFPASEERVEQFLAALDPHLRGAVVTVRKDGAAISRVHGALWSKADAYSPLPKNGSSSSLRLWIPIFA